MKEEIDFSRIYNEWQGEAETKLQELPDWQRVKCQKQGGSYTGSEGWLLWKSTKRGQNECTSKKGEQKIRCCFKEDDFRCSLWEIEQLQFYGKAQI